MYAKSRFGFTFVHNMWKPTERGNQRQIKIFLKYEKYVNHFLLFQLSIFFLFSVNQISMILAKIRKHQFYVNTVLLYQLYMCSGTNLSSSATEPDTTYTGISRSKYEYKFSMYMSKRYSQSHKPKREPKFSPENVYALKGMIEASAFQRF